MATWIAGKNDYPSYNPPSSAPRKKHLGLF
jgi:hypothetical protein